MESTVRVALTVEQRADRADVMAGLISQIGAVKAQAKAKAFEFKELVDGLMDQLEEHARVLNMGHEERSQLDLTFPEEQAAKALHDVAAAACSCTSEDVANPSCPVHGVETRGPNATCDGNHAPNDPCGDPRCYLTDDLPNEGANDVAPEGEDERLAEIRTDEPEDSSMADAIREAEVDVGTVEEPAAATEFRKARERRKRA